MKPGQVKARAAADPFLAYLKASPDTNPTGATAVSSATAERSGGHSTKVILKPLSPRA